MAKWNMTDIHMHLIPGVDDGAEDRMMALLMLLRAGDQGITSVFATPHSSAFDMDPDGPWMAYEALRREAGEHFPDMKLHLGCEVSCHAAGMRRVVAALKNGKYPTMNGTDFVLTEFSHWVTEEEPAVIVKKLVKEGFVPVIAHMERYQYLRSNMELVAALKKAGALIQVNTYSLCEEMEEEVRSWARRLVLEGQADFLGTDAHRTYHRPPCAEGGLDWLYGSVNADYADALAWGNAKRLLQA